MPTETPSTAERVIGFQAEVSSIDDTLLIRLPEAASEHLPSRGQVAVHATVQGHPFDTVVEPDGRRGHWIRVASAGEEAPALDDGDLAELTVQVSTDWPEPDVPHDLDAALTEAPTTIRDRWDDITPMARWEWVRWIQATKSPQTRQRRVEVTISKLDDGKRRPCCFDLSACTDPQLARSGKLREHS
ncbi:MAG: YdeI/OmpD-associated family protein [Ornithinimicrobium sp.]